MGKKVPYKPLVHIPRANYLGMLTRIEESEGKYGKSWNVIGTVKEGKHNGTDIAGYFPYEATPRNKTGKLISQLLGSDALKREPDIEELLNITCYLKVDDHEIKETGEVVSKLTGVIKYEPGTPTV